MDLTAETPPREDPGSRSSVIKAMARHTEKAAAVLDDLNESLRLLGRIREAAFSVPYIPTEPAPAPTGLADQLDAIADRVAHLLAEARAIERRL